VRTLVDMQTGIIMILPPPFRPYRAPELLFGTRSYDPHAIDLWSLGATFAEFFTALKLVDDEGESTSDKHSQNVRHFILSRSDDIGTTNEQWTRDSLFNSERGEISLIWSIFRIRGTPTEENWPVSILGSALCLM
jgi:serine/threonine protein kinase